MIFVRYEDMLHSKLTNIEHTPTTSSCYRSPRATRPSGAKTITVTMHAAKPDEGQGDNDTETVEFYEHDYSILFGTDSADET